MDCPGQPTPSNAAWLQQFHRRAVAERAPLSGTLELTRRCNLRCIHCYLGPQPAQWQSAAGELPTAAILRILDEITAAGCLYLLITGGEPLVRPDFVHIYRHARSAGLLVTVFTNGTLLGRAHVDLFADLPPHLVEITLYGATAATHDAVTAVPGSYDRSRAAVDALLAAGIRTGLKTMLMTSNRHELAGMEAIARDLGTSFRVDAALMPTLAAARAADRVAAGASLALRLPPEEAVALEFAAPQRRQDWLTYSRRLPLQSPPPPTEPARPDEMQTGTLQPPSEPLYTCGAGLTGFHIDPCGTLRACLMTPQPAYDLLHGTFSAGWRDAIPALHARPARPDSPCPACDLRSLCSHCPGFSALELTDEDAPVPYLCAIAHARHALIEAALLERT